MFIKIGLIFLVCSTILFSNPLKVEYSYGLHDFVVEEDTHTVGINAGLFATYNTDETTRHLLSAEVFVEHDESELDPDHIPVWFRADYGFSKMLFNQGEALKLNTIFDFSWKMNTVSSIEQYVKTGGGFAFSWKEGGFSLTPKVLLGTYYLEIDDDVPKERGFSRSDLSDGYKLAFMYGVTMSWEMAKDVSLAVELEEWKESGEWLERYASVQIKYKKYETFDVVFSVEKTTYNLSDFQKNGIDILPWNEDTLFKLAIQIPLK